VAFPDEREGWQAVHVIAQQEKDPHKLARFTK
jgi:hypothetical protein